MGQNFTAVLVSIMKRHVSRPLGVWNRLLPLLNLLRVVAVVSRDKFTYLPTMIPKSSRTSWNRHPDFLPRMHAIERQDVSTNECASRPLPAVSRLFLSLCVCVCFSAFFAFFCHQRTRSTRTLSSCCATSESKNRPHSIFLLFLCGSVSP